MKVGKENKLLKEKVIKLENDTRVSISSLDSPSRGPSTATFN